MGKDNPRPENASMFEKARDELYSHILRCGVLEADEEHQREWFNDTMEYMTERYPMLSDDEFGKLRGLGERYCQPVIPHGNTVGAGN